MPGLNSTCHCSANFSNDPYPSASFHNFLCLSWLGKEHCPRWKESTKVSLWHPNIVIEHLNSAEKYFEITIHEILRENAENTLQIRQHSIGMHHSLVWQLDKCVDRKLLEGYGLKSVKLDELRKAPRMAWMSWGCFRAL